ncbi:hypothetical protein GCM10020360_09460 [Nonlabens tegetincola]
MIRQVWPLSAHTRAFLRRYMPTNIPLDAIRTRKVLNWGVPALCRMHGAFRSDTASRGAWGPSAAVPSGARVW